ncbi:MAG: polysaccharide biosynthesis/export family protein [Bacteroidales bacterium]|nr:polysaccharide biosynthesis/export family protein [Bacteroidales bacterium]
MLKYIILFFLFASVFLTGCKTLMPSTMFEMEPDYPYQTFKETPVEFAIKPYDQLKITMATNGGEMYLEQAFNLNINNNFNQRQNNDVNSKNMLTYMVGEDSLVKIPTLGRFKLGGLTIRQAEDTLEKLFSENFQNPFIRISITNRNVIIFMERGTKGHVVNLPEESTSLLEAIASVGGLSTNSKAYKIKLIRGSNKNPEIYNYNIRNLEEFRKADFTLLANDIIYVDSRPRYMNRILSELQPYFVLFSSGVLIYSVISNEYNK